jgi:hypothetical protein
MAYMDYTPREGDALPDVVLLEQPDLLADFVNGNIVALPSVRL